MTASGELIFNIFSALAEFERRLIQECTKRLIMAPYVHFLSGCSSNSNLANGHEVRSRC
jgi:hypothetical protein